MEIGLLIFALFALLVGVVVYRFDYPTKDVRKMTGRGGDFDE